MNFPTFFNPFEFMGMGFLASLAAIAGAVVQIAFAFGVYKDGDKLDRTKAGPAFAHPAIWGIATLLGGLVVVALYWLVHYSTLRTPAPTAVDFKKPDL